MTTYYTYSSSLTPGTVAKAEDVNSRFQSVETAFTSVAADMDTTVRMALGAQSPNLTPISANVATRGGSFVQFTLAGDIAASNQFLKDFDANNKRITNLPSPVGNSEPVTLLYLINYAGSLAGVPSVTGHAGKVLYTDGATLSWNNSVLLPLQTGNNGKFLTTDGANPSWVTINQVSAIGADRGVAFLHDGTNYAWALPTANRLGNPDGAGGFISSGLFGLWTSSASVGTLTITADAATAANGGTKYGYQLRNASTTGVTGQLNSELIAADVGETWSASAEIFTAAITAGTISMAVEFLSGALAILQTDTVALTASTDKRYFKSGTAPATTAYVRFIVKWDGATAGEVRIRRCKLEKNTYATPFSLDGAVQFLLAGRASYDFGALGTTDFSIHTLAGAQAYDTRLRFSGGTGGVAGKGALLVSNLRTYFDGVVGWSSELDNGNTGAAKTIDLGAAQNQRATVNSNTTITITAPLQVQNNRLKLTDSGGPRTIAWAGTAITWAGGVSPAFSAAGKVIFVSLYYDLVTGIWGTWVEF